MGIVGGTVVKPEREWTDLGLATRCGDGGCNASYRWRSPVVLSPVGSRGVFVAGELLGHLCASPHVATVLFCLFPSNFFFFTILEHVFSLSGREKIVQNQVGFGEVKTNLEQQSRLLHERQCTTWWTT